MKIFNKNISIFDFLPHIFYRIWQKKKRQSNLEEEPEWKGWQFKAVLISLYIGEKLNSYSQFAEDIFLSELLRNKKNDGFYLDVGANHPRNLNNTYKFYLRGWRGINIESGLEMFKLLQQERPDDTNLRVGVGGKSGTGTFYEMSLNSLSTFNKEEAHIEEYEKEILKTEQIDILTLNDIYEKYYDNKNVDFINIDVEGSNLEVLLGNDWSKNRPEYILIEMHKAERLEIIPYLYKNGYYLIFDNTLNGIFCNSEFTNINITEKLSYETCLKKHL